MRSTTILVYVLVASELISRSVPWNSSCPVVSSTDVTCVVLIF